MKKDKKKKNLFKRPLFLFTSLFLAAGILFTGTIAAQAAPEESPAKEEISIKNTVEKLPKPVDPTDEALIPTKVEPAPSQEAQTLNRSPFKAAGTLTIPLDADLMLGSDTGNNPITVKKTDNLNFVGVLEVKPIKEQMSELDNGYTVDDLKQIKISGLSTGFTAKLTLPTELTFKQPINASLEGANGSFDVKSASLNGQTATVELELTNADKISNYKELKDAIMNVDDQLKVVLKSANFNAQAKPDTDYEVTGEIKGNFSATAKMGENGDPNTYSFDWVGKQNQEGASQSNPNEIALSVNYKKKKKPDENLPRESSSSTPSVTEISVNKVWKDKNDIDQNRPDQITVRLYADGEYTGKALDLSEKNQWSGSFKDLDKENTKGKIQYTVKEVRVPGYDSTVEGNAKDGFTIVNRLSEKKPWSDLFPPDYENRHPILEEVERKEEVKIVVPEEKLIVARPSEEAPIPQNPPTGESPIIMAAALFLGFSAMGLVGFIGGRKRDNQ